MKLKNLLLGTAPVLALGLGATLVTPEVSTGYSLIGGSLSHTQRDFRVFNNFTDAAANNNQTPDPMFPGYQGAVMAIWKGVTEWASEPHGDGSGDPHQPGGLGSGGANFDASFQGEATGVGGTNDNIHSELSSSSGGVLAYCETPISNGWRIRYYSSWTWQDGPGTSVGGGNSIDLQAVACHEYGHALGLGHSTSGTATMYPSILSGVNSRSINNDDQNGVRAIYGTKSASKPLITGVSISGNQITVTGQNFDSNGNQIWFTQANAGGNGQPIKVTNLTSNGTSLTATIPGNAGPGDVQVRSNGTAANDLSNAWPTDLNGGTGGTCGITQIGVGAGGANIGNLDSTSTPILGSSINLVASGFATTAGAGQLILSLNTATTPLLGGTIYVDYLNPGGVLPVSFTLGVGTAQVTLPALPSLAYTSGYAQVGVADASQPFGWAFSNGLEVTFCP